MTIQVDDNGQPLVAALQFPVYRLSEFDWKNWTPASRFYYTQFIGIDDTATPVVYSLRYCIPGVAGGVGQVSTNTLDDFQAEITDVLSRQDKIDLDVADLLAQVNSLLTTAQDVAAQAQSSVTSAAQSATSSLDFATKSSTWAEGEDAAVVELGGTHSSKGWAAQAESHAADANTAVGQTQQLVAEAESHATAASQSATAAESSATLAQSWATKTDGPVDDTEYSAKHYANQASDSATASAQSATASASSAQAAQDALDNVNGLIATPIGTIFQSIYVDETLDIARQLNGQLISSTKFTGFRAWLNTVQAAIPSLFTTEVNWQAEKANSRLGQCGKFVVDDTAGTIRLPCVINAQGLVDLALIGGIKAESLPNIKGTVGGTNRTDTGETTNGFKDFTGAFYNSGDVTDKVCATVESAKYPTNRLGFNASLSSSVYQDNAPVQQEAVQYPYYIQVATGVEETLPAIREYKVNNSDYFGKSMYSDIAPNNASWLASNGQWNARSVYPDYYDWLVGQMNAGVSGFVASTAAYTDYDFVVNTTDQTFRLPLLNGEEDLPSDRYATLTLGESGALYTASANGFYRFSVGLPASSYFAIFNNNSGDAAELITNEVASIVQNYAAKAFVKRGQTIRIQYNNTPNVNSVRFYYAQGNGTLYYYVGDIVQDASLINAGAVLGQLANINAPSRGYVVDSYQNGTDWYRVYSDGWIEQGGSVTSNSSLVTYNFHHPFTTMTYGLSCSQNSGGIGSQSNGMVISRVSTTQFSVLYTAGSNDISYTWRACGY